MSELLDPRSARDPDRAPPSPAPEPASPYLVFERCGRGFAIPAGEVDCVAPMPEVMPVPGASAAVLGVTRLGGRVLVVVDFARMLRLPPSNDAPTRCVVVACEGSFMALAVGEVAGVVEVENSRLQAAEGPEASGPGGTARFAHRERLVSVLASSELVRLAEGKAAGG